MTPAVPVSGWAWVKRGFALFRRQPAELLTLFFAYMFMNMAIGLIPVLGQILPFILIPVFAMSFMEACECIEREEKVSPKLLLVAFRAPALRRLLALGVLYLPAIAAAIFISSWFDGGALYEFLTSTEAFDPKDLPADRLFSGMLAAALAYVPALMAFWFAAPLIMWKNMSVGKAMFYSFFSVWRAGRTFLAFAGVWMLIAGIVPTIVSVIIAIIIGDPRLVVLLMMPVSALLTTVLYCSFHPTYRDTFGQPGIDTQA